MQVICFPLAIEFAKLGECDSGALTDKWSREELIRDGPRWTLLHQDLDLGFFLRSCEGLGFLPCPENQYVPFSVQANYLPKLAWNWGTLVTAVLSLPFRGHLTELRAQNLQA